jgi:hypothetical protein
MLGDDSKPKVTALYEGRRVTPREWISKYKSIPAFSRAFSQGIINESIKLNNFTHNEDGNPFRMADLQHVLRAFNVPPNDHDEHWRIIRSD